MHRQHLTMRTIRPAFTVVELLVAMGIIAILTTIAVVAIAPTLENAKLAATRTTINQINEIIQQRLDAIQQADLKTDANRLASVASISQQQAEFILRKNLYRSALPQTKEDLTAFGQTLPSNLQSLTDGQLFLFAITSINRVQAIPGGKSFLMPVLDLDNINPKHIINDSFVDAWETDLRFYNWSTRLIRPGGNDTSLSAITRQQQKVAQFLITGMPSSQNDLSFNGNEKHPLNQDSDDPTGRNSAVFVALTSPMNVPALSISIQPFREASYHTLNTFHVPLVVSAGPDRSFGMASPGAPDETRHAQPLDDQGAPWDGSEEISPDIFDNITNRQR